MRRRRLRVRALAASAALAVACAAAPPAARTPAPEQETRQVARQLGLVEDAALAELVSALGARIAAAAPEPRPELRFAVVNLPETNAFSLPGGSVYVSRGLLAFVRSEAELANVIAHELAHVLGRHAERLAARKSQVRFATLAKLATASLGGAPSPALAALELEGAGLVARYSRELEREADAAGQQLAARAGFDPAGMASFLAALDRESTFRLGRPRRPTFLDTHPAAPERAEDAAAAARALGAPARALGAPARAPDSQESFLDRLDGLLVGDDPAEGELRGGAFLHPDLDLALRFPDGWRIANTREAVVAAPPDGPALLMLGLQEEYHDPHAAAVRFLRANKRALALEQQGPLEGAALPAHFAWARLVRPGEPLASALFWFAHGGRIYRLQGIANAEGVERFAARFTETARSFRPLTPAERASFRVRRLRVIAAREGERFEDALARGGNVERLDQIALANGLDVGDRLAAGRRVKVVVEAPYMGEAETPGAP
jgi:predicted Zn-dependent protease